MKYSFAIVLSALLHCTGGVCAEKDTSHLQFHVTDESGKHVPCRIHLHDAKGMPQKPANLPFWTDHFVCPGKASIELEPGEYTWGIERGPEFHRLSGTAVVEQGETTTVVETLGRLTTLRDAGWYSGDLHVHRAVSDIELLMSAEDLDFAPVIGWWNTPAPNAQRIEETVFLFDDDRIYTTLAGEDEREGGALLYFGLKQPLDLTVKSREFPSPLDFVEQARRQNKNVWIDIEKSFWWDVPTWLATGQMNSIGIAHNHMHRGGVLNNEAWGKTRDTDRFPGVKGNGLWTQQIYYHMLNTGLRLPPSAGSASGVLPNPVGYNRVYVQLGEREFDRNNWFAGLRAGRCFVTNGPLLRVKANRQWAGHSFRLVEDEIIVALDITLNSNDPVSELEVIHNGHVINRIPCTDDASQQFKQTIRIAEPGWFLVRAIADVDQTFRFASTAPWNIETMDGKTRISHESVQFFLDWLNERIEKTTTQVSDIAQRESIMHWHLQAREFWLKRREMSNAK